MKRRILNTIAFLVFLIGAGIFLYPYISEVIYESKVNETIDEYHEAVQKDDLTLLREAMEQYNEDLVTYGQQDLNLPSAYETPSFDLSAYSFPDEIFGYLRIDKMEVYLPIYLGASEENLQKGATHMSLTSLPIGGNNTNAVIAAHRGMTNAVMFRYVTRLEAGDEVIIENPWETLTYEVVSTKTISGDDFDEVKIQEGKDMLTLLTCLKYPNLTDRYLVYCIRKTD